MEPTGTAQVRAIGYRRVSDQSQVKNYSLESQTDLITAKAAAKGWTLAEIREERGGAGSGKNTSDRATLLRTLDDLDAGRFGALIVTRLDRLSRNTIDGLKIIDRANAAGWAIVVLEPEIDTSTKMGRMFAGMLLLFAEYERSLILERTENGRAAAKVAGKHLGRRTAVPDAVVERIATERAGGGQLQVIADRLNADGILSATGRPWNTGTVSRIANSVTAARLAAA